MIGKTISHYRIVDELGRGGMGVVYLAEDTKLGRKAALKFLPDELAGDQEARARFAHEARAAAALNHPNICTIYDVSDMDEKLFIAMEHVEGETLADRISRGPLAVEEALDVVSQIALGLQKAHEKGIVHRDIKSANIMVNRAGLVKIMDFGLAKSRDADKLTREGTTLGTIGYMSPEQVQGRKVDRRSDIWSLGVLYYEMISGRKPFRGDYDQAKIYSILNDQPEPLTAIRTGVPLEMERITGKCMAKDPAERYQDADDLLADLRSAGRKGSGEGIIPGGPGNISRKKFRAAIITILIFGTLSTAIIWNFFLRKDGPRAIDSIAVLPLENISGNPEQEYFVDGMTEALITELAQISALNVISRTTVMRYKDTSKPLPEIADELGVNAIIEGSAILAGDSIRITAQLIEAETDRHLWAKDYSREMKNILNLQKEVARAIVSEIHVTLTPEEVATLDKARIVDPETHNLFLKGLYLSEKWNAEELFAAIEILEEVVERDPTFYEAHAHIAKTYNNLVSNNQIDHEDGMAHSKKWAVSAIEGNPELAEAHLVMADIVAFVDWNWEGAEPHYRNAIELNPGLDTTYLWYTSYLVAFGRAGEAIQYMEKASEINPIDYFIFYYLGMAYFYSGEYDKAEEACLESIELNRDQTVSYYTLARISISRSEPERALKWCRVMEENSSGKTARYHSASLLAMTGYKDQGRERLEEYLSTFPPENYNKRMVWRTYAALEDYENVFVWLERAYDDRDTIVMYIYSDPMLDPIRSDPRFKDLTKRLRFPD